MRTYAFLRMLMLNDKVSKSGFLNMAKIGQGKYGDL